MTTGRLLSQALALYRFECPEAELIRHNENMTYSVVDRGKRYVLRIHQPVEGFSLDIFDTGGEREAFIRSELAIIAALKDGTALPMQAPVRGIDGDCLQTLAGGAPVTLLEWVEGQTVEDAEVTPELLKNIGKLAAEMHTFFLQNTDTSHGRYRYDQTLLPPIAEKIGSAARAGAVTQPQARSILDALDEMRRRFDELDAIQEKCIVHADLSKSNMVVNPDGRITPIDFSLCGYSHYYMDIGSLFGHIDGTADRRAILEGYRSAHGREVKPRYVEPYFALQVILFIACQYERSAAWDWFPGAMERWRNELFEPLAQNKSLFSLLTFP